MFEMQIDDRFFVKEGGLFKELTQDLFFREEFYQLHRKSFDQFLTFQLVDKHRKESYGACHFVEIEKGHFKSPGRGSYGGAQFHSTISFSVREQFLKAVHERLLSLGAKKIDMIMPPEIYNLEDHSFQINILHRMRYHPKTVDLNYSFDLNQDFENAIDHGNRKRLKKAESENLQFVKLPKEKLIEAYNVIKENRQKKGYPLTMTFEALEAMDKAAENRVFSYAILKDNKNIASSICLHINEKIKYVFYWGEIAGVENISPITTMAAELFKLSKSEGYKILDLGISTVASEANLGLMKYKSNLGCQSGLKMTVSWDIRNEA